MKWWSLERTCYIQSWRLTAVNLFNLWQFMSFLRKCKLINVSTNYLVWISPKTNEETSLKSIISFCTKAAAILGKLSRNHIIKQEGSLYAQCIFSLHVQQSGSPFSGNCPWFSGICWSSWFGIGWLLQWWKNRIKTALPQPPINRIK